MRIIIAGSRTFCEKELWDLVFGLVASSKFNITEVVSGGAKGADQFGEYYAHENKIPVKQFLPNYTSSHPGSPRQAPLYRNERMADYADGLIALWDGKSRGTHHMIACMKIRKKPVEIIKI